MMEHHRYYRVQLGVAARQRGDYVICEVLDWTGTAQNLAKIRIVRSTLPSYRLGKIGLVQRERLEPVRRGAAGVAASHTPTSKARDASVCGRRPRCASV